MPTLATPLAFEVCDGKCGAVKVEPDKPHASCGPSDGCTGDCYCQMFYRAKGAADTSPWIPSATDKNKLSSHNPDKFEYSCICVKPVLEQELTLDGVTYNLRYQLCGGGGSCGLDPVKELGKKENEFKCSGTCDAGCKCTLFRLQVGGKGFDISKAKWERAAKTDETIKVERNFVYRCFCVK